MREKEDYRKYLSIDNGRGILLNSYDALILDQYNIDYYNVSDIKELILVIGNYIDDNQLSELEDLEDVLMLLNEVHYYNEVKK